MSAPDLPKALPLANDTPDAHRLDFLDLTKDGVGSERYVLTETEELILSLNERLSEVALEESILRALRDDSPGAAWSLMPRTSLTGYKHRRTNL